MSEEELEVSVADLRADLADYLNAAIQGEIVYVTNRGRQIAAIVPVRVAKAAAADR